PAAGEEAGLACGAAAGAAAGAAGAAGGAAGAAGAAGRAAGGGELAQAAASRAMVAVPDILRTRRRLIFMALLLRPHGSGVSSGATGSNRTWPARGLPRSCLEPARSIGIPRTDGARGGRRSKNLGRTAST